jgi:hypothetical protein
MKVTRRTLLLVSIFIYIYMYNILMCLIDVVSSVCMHAATCMAVYCTIQYLVYVYTVLSVLVLAVCF